MNKTFGSLKLRHRLYAGFAVIVLLLAGAIATMLWQVGRIDEVTNRIANLRTPTALAAERLTADVQGTLAALRGYLLTGNDAFKAERQAVWTDIDAAAGKMDSLSSSWTNPDNLKAWSVFKTVLEEFRGAQGKVESSADFTNIKPAVDLLVHEAAPRGKHLLEILVGAIGADGRRTGGMVDDQVGLLQSDTASGAAASTALLLTEWILLVLGVVIGGGIAFITARAISRPLVGMTDAMRQLADGSLDVMVPGKDRRDEIGDMAGAVEVFKQNAIRVRDMNGAEAERQAEAQRRGEAMHNLMSRLSSVVRAATDGNFSQRIELELTDSDLAAVASGVNELVETVDRGLGETGGVLSSLAQTDLTRRVEGEYRGAFAQLKTDTNAVVENLAGVVGQLRGTSGTLRTATREILSGANDLANRTTKQAAAVEETSAAMEQLAKTVTDNAKRAEQANAESQAVSVIGAQAGEVMKQSNNAMDRISASSGSG